MSHSNVVPLDIEGPQVPQGQGQGQPVGVRISNVPGKPGTASGLGFHITSLLSSIIASACMLSTDFTAVRVFSLLVGADMVNCTWCLALVLLDVYAMMVRRGLRNNKLVRLFTIGDGIVGLLLFIAASASGAISDHMDRELSLCATSNECGKFKVSVVSTFISFFVLIPTFFLNFSSWVYILQ